MNIIIGSAKIDENGKISGGCVGDQKQKTSANDYIGEVSMEPFYVHSKGWYILRPISSIIATKIAANMETACNNKNIGYDQGNRHGIVKYGINTKVATECDCSSLVRQCVKEASEKDPGNFTTSNEATMLEATGLFEKKKIYTSKTILYTGDILVTKTKGHTVVVVKGNERVSSNANSSSTSSSPAVNVFYKVYANNRWYDEVINLGDYAGDNKKPIRAIAIKVDSGSVKYRVHCRNRGWYPYVTGYNVSDFNNGYAGDKLNDIDAVEVCYISLSDLPAKKARYRVSPIGKNYYDWQYNNEKTNGQDGYAGVFGVNIGKFQITME